MGRPLFCERLRFVGDGQRTRLVEALQVLEEWANQWSNRYSPRFHDPATTVAQARRIREITKDQLPLRRLQRWISGSRLEYQPGKEIRKALANSGRVRLFDCSDTQEWVDEVLTSLANSPTRSIRLDLLRSSAKDDTSLYLDVKSRDSGSVSIELLVLSFAAIEDESVGNTLSVRLKALTATGFFREIAEEAD